MNIDDMPENWKENLAAGQTDEKTVVISDKIEISEVKEQYQQQQQQRQAIEMSM